jgi:hypothetical protein
MPMQKCIAMKTEPLEKHHLRINTGVSEYEKERKLAYGDDQH